MQLLKLKLCLAYTLEHTHNFAYPGPGRYQVRGLRVIIRQVSVIQQKIHYFYSITHELKCNKKIYKLNK